MIDLEELRATIRQRLPAWWRIDDTGFFWFDLAKKPENAPAGSDTVSVDIPTLAMILIELRDLRGDKERLIAERDYWFNRAQETEGRGK